MAKRKPGLFARGAVWWLRTDPVTGKPISTHCRSRGAAELFREERERIAANPALAASLSATLGEWCDQYADDREAHGLSAKYADQKLGAVLSVLPRETRLADVTPELVDHYLAERAGQGIKTHTLTKEIGQLVLVMRHAKRYGAWAGDPDTIRPTTLKKGYSPRKRALPPEEVDALIAECSPSLASFVARCVSYSCRLAEVYATDIDPKTGRATIHGTKTERSERLVPLLPPFARLGEIAKGEPHGKNNLRRDLLAACKRAGIARATANDLRRTFDTTLSEAGVPHAIIAVFMGHSGTQMTAGVYDWARFTELEARAREVLQNRYTADSVPPSSLRATQDSNLRPSAPEASSGVPSSTGVQSDNAELADSARVPNAPGYPSLRHSSATPDRFDLAGAALAAFLRSRARRAA